MLGHQRQQHSFLLMAIDSEGVAEPGDEGSEYSDLTVG